MFVIVAKLSRDGKPESCRPIQKVDLRTARTGSVGQLVW